MELKVLFKYRPMNPEYLDFNRSIVANNKLYFSTPSKFNDPFDTIPAISIDCSPEELNQYNRILAAENLPNGSDSERAALALQYGARSYEERLAKAREALVDCAKHGALCSLSARADSILMWSHYAANHTGICLVFAFPTDWAHPVIYSNERPVLNRIKIALSAEKDWEAYARALMTKADCWAYEEEWRVLGEDGPGERPFPPKALIGIIFGARATLETRNLVSSWVKERGVAVDFFDAVPDPDLFRMNIVPPPGSR